MKHVARVELRLYVIKIANHAAIKLVRQIIVSADYETKRWLTKEDILRGLDSKTSGFCICEEG